MKNNNQFIILPQGIAPPKKRNASPRGGAGRYGPLIEQVNEYPVQMENCPDDQILWCPVAVSGKEEAARIQAYLHGSKEQNARKGWKYLTTVQETDEHGWVIFIRRVVISRLTG